MKVKEESRLGKYILVIAGFALCILKWCGVLPGAEVKEIWLSVAFAYGVGFGTIDWNICRDTWQESKASATESPAAEGGPSE